MQPPVLRGHTQWYKLGQDALLSHTEQATYKFCDVQGTEWQGSCELCPTAPYQEGQTTQTPEEEEDRIQHG